MVDPLSCLDLPHGAPDYPDKNKQHHVIRRSDHMARRSNIPGPLTTTHWVKLGLTEPLNIADSCERACQSLLPGVKWQEVEKAQCLSTTQHAAEWRGARGKHFTVAADQKRSSGYSLRFRRADKTTRAQPPRGERG